MWNLVKYSNIFTYLYNFPCENLFRYYIMSNFLNKYVRTFVGKIYLIQIISDIRSCWNFHEYHTLVKGPSGLYNPRRYHTVYLLDSWYMYSLIYTPNIPQTSPRYHQDIPNLSTKIHPPDISKIYIIYPPDIPQISKRYPKNISPKYPHRYKVIFFTGIPLKS